MSRYAKNITRVMCLLIVLGLTMIIVQAFILLIPPAQAATGESAVKFHGNLVVVTCKVNDDQDRDISFGDSVREDLIDGKTYDAQPVPVTVTCDGTLSGTLQYALQGMATPFDAAAISTDMTDLGIRILKDGKPQSLGTWNTIEKDQTVNLTVVPVKVDGVHLKGGKFHGTATLVVRIT